MGNKVSWFTHVATPIYVVELAQSLSRPVDGLTCIVQLAGTCSHSTTPLLLAPCNFTGASVYC